jgi:hypothetical protein
MRHTQQLFWFNEIYESQFYEFFFLAVKPGLSPWRKNTKSAPEKLLRNVYGRESVERGELYNEEQHNL